MISFLKGKISQKDGNFLVLDVGRVGFKLYCSQNTLQELGPEGKTITVFTYLHVRDDILDLYGFANLEEKALFEALISVSSVGPRSAINIMGVAQTNALVAAINTGNSDLISKASGVGCKTAQRISLELKGKLNISAKQSSKTLNLLEQDVDLEETLVSLGYAKSDAKKAISKIDPKITNFNARLKDALKGGNKKVLGE